MDNIIQLADTLAAISDSVKSALVDEEDSTIRLLSETHLADQWKEAKAVCTISLSQRSSYMNHT